MELLHRGVLDLPFCLKDQVPAVAVLLRKYGNIPMSLADACLVRMAELFEGSSILTLDAHFDIYRKNKRQVIPLLAPP
jgi:predicted nucleic acid-binding protein